MRFSVIRMRSPNDDGTPRREVLRLVDAPNAAIAQVNANLAWIAVRGRRTECQIVVEPVDAP